jgi:hypothetical protein
MHTNTATSFNAIEWISQFVRSGNAITLEDLQQVLEFTLIWNLFEKHVGTKFITLEKIRSHADKSVADGLIDISSFETHLLFFRSRYPDHQNQSILGDRLLSDQRRNNLKDGGYVRLLSEVLEKKVTDPNNIIFSLLFIAYRVRNNLFHGEKDIYTLHLQKALFIAVNSLLSIYLNQTSEQIKG